MKKIILLFAFSTFSFIFAQTDIPQADNWKWEKYENNPVLTVGPAGEWDSQIAYFPCVRKIDGIYHIWYSGYNGNLAAIGYATSPDGKAWTKYEGNPVLVSGGEGTWPNEGHMMSPEVYFDGETFHMWYTGLATGSGFRGRIGYASSSDGKNWIKSENNPVLTVGEGVIWDSNIVGFPSVMREGDQYRMWYMGSSSNSRSDLETFGTATSSDGINWEKYIDPIMEICQGEEAISQPEVIKQEEDVYYMWYTEGPWEPRLSIRYAYSLDGMEWTQFPGHFALDAGEDGEWDSRWVGFQSILYDEVKDFYEMWYFGAKSGSDIMQIGYASASNPLTDISPLDKVPVEYSLSQSYPNPFNPNTTIKYQIPLNEKRKTLNVKLIVYDVLGREIATLVNEQQKPGNFEVVWNAVDQPSGVYFYRISTEKFSQVKKMMLLK